MCMYTHISLSSSCTYTHPNTFAGIFWHANAYMYACMWAHIHTHTHTHTHIQTHTPIHTYTHTHTQTQSLRKHFSCNYFFTMFLAVLDNIVLDLYHTTFFLAFFLMNTFFFCFVHSGHYRFRHHFVYILLKQSEIWLLDVPDCGPVEFKSSFNTYCQVTFYVS